MYIGELKLENLKAYIAGYQHRVYDDFGEELYMEFLQDFPRFDDWVANKFGYYESTAGWHNMILAKEMGFAPENPRWDNLTTNATEEQHKNSVIRFFDLINEFKNT